MDYLIIALSTFSQDMDIQFLREMKVKNQSGYFLLN